MDDEIVQFDNKSTIYDFYYCTECGSDKLCLDRERDEIYCSICGLVLDEKEVELIVKAKEVGQRVVRNKDFASVLGKSP